MAETVYLNNQGPPKAPAGGLGPEGAFGKDVSYNGVVNGKDMSNGRTAPVDGQFQYADPNAYKGAHTGQVYDDINYGFDRAGQSAPMAGLTQLGHAAQYGGAQVGAMPMLQGASIAPQMMTGAAGLNTAQDNQYAAAQNAGINALAAQAQGMGPSVAETQARQQAQQNIAAQMGALGSQRGAGNAALGQRAAAMQGAQANQAAAQAGALGRSQEALSAQQQLTGALGGARGQSQSTATTQANLNQQANLANQGAFNQAGLQQASLNQQAGLANQSLAGQTAQANAGYMQQAGLANQGALNQYGLQQGAMNQQTALANQQAIMQQTGMNNQQYAAYLQALQTQNQQDVQNQQAYQNAIQSSELGIYGANAGVNINQANNTMGAVGAGISAAGALAGLAAASDRRLKTEIHSAETALGAFLATFGGE